MCDLSGECECWVAVTRAFRELKERNVPDVSAFDAATEIYRFHHPEVPWAEARYTIAEWLEENA